MDLIHDLKGAAEDFEIPKYKKGIPIAISSASEEKESIRIPNVSTTVSQS